jgi:ribonuclease E
MTKKIEEASPPEAGVATNRDDSDPAEGSEPTEAGAPRPRRRRSRGGRGRRRPGSGATTTAKGTHPNSESADAPSAGAPGADVLEGAAEATSDGSGAKPAGATRRRRRGGRGRGRSKTAQASADAEGVVGGEEPDAAIGAADPDEGKSTGSTTDAEAAPKPRRSRTRRKPSSSAEPGVKADDASEDGAADAEGDGAPKRRRRRTSSVKSKDEAETKTKSAVKERAKSPAKTDGRRRTREPAGTSGPTRLRRGRTGTHRRREPTPVIRQDEDKIMVLTENGERDQIAVLEGRDLVQHYVTRTGARSMVGNVYLGRVQNVLPGMEAAFVDVGRGRNAVLYAGEVNYSDEDLEGPAPRIEQVLKNGQSILVQVTKDPMGGKGSRLSAQISLPGRYLVLVPNSQVSGISRRLPDDERRRLKAIVKKLKPESHGIIVRTAAFGASEEALAADVARLEEEWDSIQTRAKRAKAPFLLYEEPELTVRVVRDLFTDGEYKELVTDSPRIHEKVAEYLQGVAPDVLEKVHLRQGKLPVFEEFHIVEQIHKGLDRKVWLPSGGYLVIERTEAMTVIDVNTGKHVGKRNLEETVVKTNIEAASEVARQLRLRDIGGIIIIDFIDMVFEANKQQVVETLREAMAQDKTRSQVFDIGPLGLLEVTRKRVSAGLLESFSETCPTCEGRGILLTHEI